MTFPFLKVTKFPNDVLFFHRISLQLHKIRITFVIMLILDVKTGTLCVILTNFLSVVFYV